MLGFSLAVCRSLFFFLHLGPHLSFALNFITHLLFLNEGSFSRVELNLFFVFLWQFSKLIVTYIRSWSSLLFQYLNPWSLTYLTKNEVSHVYWVRGSNVCGSLYWEIFFSIYLLGVSIWLINLTFAYCFRGLCINDMAAELCSDLLHMFITMSYYDTYFLGKKKSFPRGAQVWSYVISLCCFLN